MSLGVLALKVRTLKGGVILANPNPFQGIDDSLGPFGLVTSFVGVFDAQHECATQALGQGPVVESSSGATDVKETSGRWSKTKTRGS